MTKPEAIAILTVYLEAQREVLAERQQKRALQVAKGVAPIAKVLAEQERAERDMERFCEAVGVALQALQR